MDDRVYCRADERASITPLMIVVLVVMVGLLAVIGRIGSNVIDSARADVYADSVALAAAGGDDATARAVADGNGARVEVIDRDPAGTTNVVVSYRGHTSRAAARLGPGRP